MLKKFIKYIIRPFSKINYENTHKAITDLALFSEDQYTDEGNNNIIKEQLLKLGITNQYVQSGRVRTCPIAQYLNKVVGGSWVVGVNECTDGNIIVELPEAISKFIKYCGRTSGEW